MGKISEEKSRTAEAQELMDRLAAQVSSLTTELREEVQKGVETRRLLRDRTREAKCLQKMVNDAEVAAEKDEVLSEYQIRLRRRLHYTSRVSSYSAAILLEDEYSRTFLNRERQQLFIEQGVLNAVKLAVAKYWRQFFNDASEKRERLSWYR